MPSDDPFPTPEGVGPPETVLVQSQDVADVVDDEDNAKEPT